MFLDELADIPLPVQAKLLRVLERQEVQPVGGSESQAVDVRVISATHADLSTAVRAGTFRHDLFFRLNVYPIHLPPFRDRVDDIPLLADYFLRKFGVANPVSVLAADTLGFLKARPWPGNVRELAMRSNTPLSKPAAARCAQSISPNRVRPPARRVPPNECGRWLPNGSRTGAGARRPRAGRPAQKIIEEIEPAVLDEVLRQVQGNRLVAARWLGLAALTVRKLIRKYHPDTSEPEEDE